MEIFKSLCIKCDESSYWIKNNYEIGEIIHPIKQIFFPNEGMFDECKELYKEASLIFEYSTIAACVLLRICLEKMLKIIYKIKDKKYLYIQFQISKK